MPFVTRFDAKTRTGKARIPTKSYLNSGSSASFLINTSTFFPKQKYGKLGE